MSDKLDIGAVASLKIDVLTETGWFDDARFKQNHQRSRQRQQRSDCRETDHRLDGRDDRVLATATAKS